MTTVILEAIDPSVESSGLSRCCRHRAIGWRIDVKFGECGTIDGVGGGPPASKRGGRSLKRLV